jgi:pyruvate/2-oxoglutarate dehydrogenase complex dihydrolipoamide acyltransferase (E2) component
MRPPPVGPFTARRPPFFRRVAMETFDAIPAGHTMAALVELDVTDVRTALRQARRNGRPISLFAHVVSSIARALSEHPELNSIRGRSRVYSFDEVDVNVPVEVGASGDRAPRQLVIRDAGRKTPEQIHREIDEARSLFERSGRTGDEDRWAMALVRALLVLPRFVRSFILRRVSADPLRVKRMSGTTSVTSVDLAGVSGFAMPYVVGPKAVFFALGGVTRKPAAAGSDVRARQILSMTVVFNHDLVDGVPAARFVRRLKGIVENVGGAA